MPHEKLSIEVQCTQLPVQTEVCHTLLVRNFDLVITKALVPVVQKLDNAIHWIIAIQWISVNKTNQAIHQIVIYPVDRVIHLLNNPGLVVQWLEHRSRIRKVASSILVRSTKIFVASGEHSFSLFQEENILWSICVVLTSPLINIRLLALVTVFYERQSTRLGCLENPNSEQSRIANSEQLTIIHRSGGEQWWIFTEPRSGEVNIHHFHRH